MTEKQAIHWKKELQKIKPSRFDVEIEQGKYGNWRVIVSLGGVKMNQYSSENRLRRMEEL